MYSRAKPDFVSLTLVELLVAMAILVTVMTSTMLIFRGITQAWRKGHLHTERYQQVRLLFDLFARELSSCIANSRYPLIGHGASYEAPLKPQSRQAEIFFVGALPGRGGLVERGYWVNSEDELMCHDDEPADGDYSSTGTDELCGNGVAEFEASFFDGTIWLAQWDGRHGAQQAGQVPKAIQIKLTVGRQDQEQFETLIHVPSS